MKLLRVLFGNKIIENKEIVKLEDVQQQPKIKFSYPANTYYTIMMIDKDAPVSKAVNKSWLHWLIINNIDEIIHFKPPTPPKGSGFHRYYIYLLEQQNKINIKEKIDISKFDFIKFIEEYKLKPISFVMFKTKHPED